MSTRELKDYLSREEIYAFTQRSDWQAFRMLAFNWLAIFALLAFVYLWTNPLSLLLVLLLLPGRQLGLAIIMHECGHNTFFTSKKKNDFFGQWFAAYPVLQELHAYARGHLAHHQYAGTTNDPDLGNYRNYPVSVASFRRKVSRDLCGQTGWKLLRYVLMGASKIFSADRKQRRKAIPFVHELLVQGLLLLFLSLFMAPWLYLLWIVSWLTVYMFIVRFRQVAEHAAVEEQFAHDPRRNTRTTIPSWIERAVFAPNYVNYHLEHHFLASVPCYKLKQLHNLLRARGAYEDTPIANGYLSVLREAVV